MRHSNKSHYRISDALKCSCFIHKHFCEKKTEKRPKIAKIWFFLHHWLWRHNQENITAVYKTHLVYLLSIRIDHLHSLKSTGSNVANRAIQQRFLFRCCDVIDDVIDKKIFRNLRKVIPCRMQPTRGQHDEYRRNYLNSNVWLRIFDPKFWPFSDEISVFFHCKHSSSPISG